MDDWEASLGALDGALDGALELELDELDFNFVVPALESKLVAETSESGTGSDTASASTSTSASATAVASTSAPGSLPAAAPASAPAAPESEAELKKKRNAEASRKLRCKRKLEKDTLRRKIQAVSAENGLLLKRIAQLQTEVQTFRVNGAVDLSKENELLRAEIKKHKHFIEGVVAATESHELRPEEERYRLLRSGIDSAVAQIVGLSYTSAMGVDWTEAEPIDIKGQDIQVRFQPLPFNCAPSEVQRVNVRIDMLAVTMGKQAMLGRLKRLLFNRFVTNAMMAQFNSLDNKTRSFMELPGPRAVGLEERFARDKGVLKVYQYAADSEDGTDGVCTCACLATTVNSNIMYVDRSENGAANTGGMVPATIVFMSTAALDEVLGDGDGDGAGDNSGDGGNCDRTGGAVDGGLQCMHMFEGFVLLESATVPGACDIVFTASFPNEDPLSMLAGSVTNDTDTGLSRTFATQLRMIMGAMLMLPDAAHDDWAAALDALLAQKKNLAHPQSPASAPAPAPASAVLPSHE